MGNLLGGLHRAVGAAVRGAIVPVEQQARDGKANEGPSDGGEEGVDGGVEGEQHANEPDQKGCIHSTAVLSSRWVSTANLYCFMQYGDMAFHTVL